MAASEREMAEIEKKRQLAMDQVYRQQQYIQELQDKDYKARQ